MDTNSPVYHRPVMPAECIEGLNIKAGGIYVDVTFGGGGHSRLIMQAIEAVGGGTLIGFDQDPDAAPNAARLAEEFAHGPNFKFVYSNFSNLKSCVNQLGYTHVSGILADLGVSSHQIDKPERGFSTRFDAPLDMRMNTASEQTDAAQLINTSSEAQLHKIFGIYGEIKNAKTLAARIIWARTQAPIQTTAGLIKTIEDLAPRSREYKYFAQVFQALRIVVNDELGVLKEFLEQSSNLLAPEGRLVIMSYHSLEDRLVKNYMAKGNFNGISIKDFYGNEIRPLQPLTRKPVEASPQELSQNKRARSASLRIAEKISI